MKTLELSLAVIATLLLSGQFVGAADAKTNTPSCCAAKGTVDCLSDCADRSLYQLEAKWTNDTGQPQQLRALKGRPQIVTMFFANCQYACPLLVYKMKQIEAALPATVRTNVGFTLVSFDSERDTPTALHNYRAQHQLADNWTLLCGNADEVLDLSSVLGVSFKRDARGQFAHSNLITVLNAEGEVAFQESGLDPNIQELVQHIRQLVDH